MKSSSIEFYIGVDSGGTKCELMIESNEKKILFNNSYKGIHYSVSGSEIYSDVIASYIRDSIHTTKLELKNCLGICLGIAGAREEKDRKKIYNALSKKLNFENIRVTTDAMTALYGAFEGKDGIILISGTGSVLYGYTNGKIFRVGGWGRVIGDEGSGYWIGRKALNCITKEFDEQKKNPSMLSRRLYKELGINKTNVNEKVFQPDFEMQKIAPIVIECAEKKCRIGIKIINKAVKGLLYLIKVFLRISKRKNPIQIAFIGGIVENENILSNKLKNEIRKLKIVEVVKKKYSSAYGAILILRENSEITGKLQFAKN